MGNFLLLSRILPQNASKSLKTAISASYFGSRKTTTKHMPETTEPSRVPFFSSVAWYAERPSSKSTVGFRENGNSKRVCEE
jgi:hypothetical protein